MKELTKTLATIQTKLKARKVVIIPLGNTTLENQKIY